MTIKFTKKQTTTGLQLTRDCQLKNFDPKKISGNSNKLIFNFGAYSNANCKIGNVQEKLLQALAGAHTCYACDDPDDIFTLTEQDLKEAKKRFLDGDSYLFGDIKVKELRYDAYYGIANLTTDKGDVLNIDLLTEAEKNDGVDSSKGIFNKSDKAENITKNVHNKQKNDNSALQSKHSVSKKDVEAFLLALAHKESTGDSMVVNSLGYVGLYQVGEEALADVGVYYETKNINYKKNDWKGYIKGGNKYGITSLWDFRCSPDKQKSVQIDFKKKHWGYLENMGLTKYVGKTINGVKITKSGLLAGAHLGGLVGVRDYLCSNGRIDNKDSNGTKVSYYIKKFAGYDVREITG